MRAPQVTERVTTFEKVFVEFSWSCREEPKSVRNDGAALTTQALFELFPETLCRLDITQILHKASLSSCESTAKINLNAEGPKLYENNH